MKHRIFLIIFLKWTIFLFLAEISILSSVCLAQINTDTIFLKREKTESSYNIVYVETDTSLWQYNKLVPRKLIDNELTYIENQINNMKLKFRDIKRFDLTNFPCNWSELSIHKDRYYVYYPSDTYFINSYNFTDSAMIRHTGEGPVAYVYNDIEIISDRKIKFTINSCYESQQIRIYYLTKQRDLAIWEVTNDDYRFCKLMVDSREIKKYPLAISKCSSGKCLHELKSENEDLQIQINNAW